MYPGSIFGRRPESLPRGLINVRPSNGNFLGIRRPMSSTSFGLNYRILVSISICMTEQLKSWRNIERIVRLQPNREHRAGGLDLGVREGKIARAT